MSTEEDPREVKECRLIVERYCRQHQSMKKFYITIFTDGSYMYWQELIPEEKPNDV